MATAKYPLAVARSLMLRLYRAGGDFATADSVVPYHRLQVPSLLRQGATDVASPAVPGWHFEQGARAAIETAREIAVVKALEPDFATATAWAWMEAAFADVNAHMRMRPTQVLKNTRSPASGASRAIGRVCAAICAALWEAAGPDLFHHVAHHAAAIGPASGCDRRSGIRCRTGRTPRHDLLALAARPG